MSSAAVDQKKPAVDNVVRKMSKRRYLADLRIYSCCYF